MTGAAKFSRTQRRVLRREVTAFPAVLPTRLPGIRFTASITATVYPEYLPTRTVPELAHLVRTTLRAATSEIASRLDPTDLPGAREMCDEYLGRPRLMLGAPAESVQGSVHLGLDQGARSALQAIAEAQQHQTIQDLVFLQHARAKAAALADPAVLLASRVSEGGDLSGALPDTGALKATAAVFATLRSGPDEPIEYQVTEILRSFLGSFERHDQKQLMLTVLASAMRAVKQNEHAQAVETLAQSSRAQDQVAGDPVVSKQPGSRL